MFNWVMRMKNRSLRQLLIYYIFTRRYYSSLKQAHVLRSRMSAEQHTINKLHNFRGVTPLQSVQRENKAWAWVCADGAWVDRCVWTSPPLHRRSGRGAWVMQAQAEANSHFLASKSRQHCNVWSPGSRGFPFANTTWARIHCGGAASADCGDHLLFSLCFHVEVRALWAVVCSCSWVGVGFQCVISYKWNYSGWMIRRKKVFYFAFSLSLSASLLLFSPLPLISFLLTAI